MGVALLLGGGESGEPSIGADAVARLADLGITHVALLQDGHGAGVVLEGWAFDGAHAAEAARVVFPNGAGSVRVLREAASVALSTATREDRT